MKRLPAPVGPFTLNRVNAWPHKNAKRGNTRRLLVTYLCKRSQGWSGMNFDTWMYVETIRTYAANTLNILFLLKGFLRFNADKKSTFIHKLTPNFRLDLSHILVPCQLCFCFNFNLSIITYLESIMRKKQSVILINLPKLYWVTPLKGGRMKGSTFYVSKHCSRKYSCNHYKHRFYCSKKIFKYMVIFQISILLGLWQSNQTKYICTYISGILCFLLN